VRISLLTHHPFMDTRHSSAFFERAKEVIPGGVNSPVRAFRPVGGNPLFIAKASGSRIWDVDGNEYIDYVASWGALILGHAHPRVLAAVKSAADGGTSFGAPTEIELKMAELVCRIVPSVQMIRMVNSGTEATMSAVRLARAFTKREKIIKFEGCYHGHGDSFLIKAGSGVMTFGAPDSPGVLPGVAAGTLSATFNDIASVSNLFARNKNEVAAVIIEPVVGNMGCVPPNDGFLGELRDLCTRERALLIFDEVMTGFRLALGGAQEIYNILPDLTTLGKIIGGGLPVGAYGGRREIMELVSPRGPVYQAGTLSGNPLAMSAGYETLRIILEDAQFYSELERKARRLEDGIRQNMRDEGLTLIHNRVGSMSTLFFTPDPVRDYRSAEASNTKRFALYFQEMLRQGVYFPPSQFEAMFLTAAHTNADIEKTITASRTALRTAMLT
jgi:glutamate-1-semialdehyde 2,1-aminomutase